MEAAKFQVRLSAELHAQVAEAATKAGRSMNSEIVKRLEDSFSKVTIEARVAALEKAVAQLKKGR